MKKKIISNVCMFGIIFLFLGASFIPTIIGIEENKTKDINLLNFNYSPTVNITTFEDPEDRWALGNQTISGTANDPDGIVLVQIAIVENGTLPGEDDWVNVSGTTSWSYIWHTYDYIEYYVRYDIHARAMNTTGQWGYADPKVNIEIDNTPPIIVILRPMEGTTYIFNRFVIWNGDKTIVISFRGFSVQIYATDPHHSILKIDEENFIFHYGIYLESVFWSGPFWGCKWEIRRAGTFEIYAECQDRAGNIGESIHYDVYYFNI